ncbi:predicted protein [Pyrenophora tritici-repentis Pt-1C-BFP]|uniref:Uncharacterized protein n=1 Tax=Pyrenophora tritici-repentis (strain Pt-1C-BFP) TaxID=426418 RepID=B2VW89_PYRTR|nr:uncharacterized protein PTRG_01451 [Pyrenophora tritici-repentis Pt-1C-BFP]EDU40889.1 predicted protein [Pyrenophora tritici-repentis Pt-1C-BFP]
MPPMIHADARFLTSWWSWSRSYHSWVPETKGPQEKIQGSDYLHAAAAGW